MPPDPAPAAEPVEEAPVTPAANHRQANARPGDNAEPGAGRGRWFAGFLLTFLLAGGLLGYIAWERIEHADATFGVIVVETPQVYTRERLVNDRFVQEGWLRKVLREEPNVSAFSESSSTSERRRTIVQVGGEAGSNATGKGSDQPAGDKNKGAGEAPADAGADRALGLPPSLDFMMRNSFRELVRGHMIENQLDDRHDVRGTTLYLLKFDASILPGNNTRRPAFVKVRVHHEDSTPLPVGGGKVEDYLEHYLANQDSYTGAENYKLFREWMKSLEERLNSVLSDVLRRFSASEFRYSEYSNFLDVIAESKTNELFFSWSSALLNLNTEREALRADRREKTGRPGAGADVRPTPGAPQSADNTTPPNVAGAPAPGQKKAAGRGDAPQRARNQPSAPTRKSVVARELTDASVDARFHFLAKFILGAAAAEEKVAFDADKIRGMLVGTEPLPEAPDAADLRTALLSYTIRRAGKYVVGDTTFSLGEFQGALAPSAEITSRTLRPFIEMQLQRRRNGLYEVEVKARAINVYALGAKPNEAVCGLDKPEGLSDELAKRFDLLATYSAYVGGQLRVIPVYQTKPEKAGDQELLDATETNEMFLQPQMVKLLFSQKYSSGIKPYLEFLPNEYESCFDVAEQRFLPTGYLRFVNGILDNQSYTYATLPRMDIQLAEAREELAQEDKLSGNAPQGRVSGTIGNEFRRMVHALQPKTTVVGFAGYCKQAAVPYSAAPPWWRVWDKSPKPKMPSLCIGGPSGPDELNFGWVLSAPLDSKISGALAYRPMPPNQRSLSALVTLPSWWKRVSVFVEAGWVDDEGNLLLTTEQSYPVALPIDHESLDSILIGLSRRDTHRPTIAVERLPEILEVEACQPAEMLIPGRRLWRSTVVVLGGQQAKEVLVLPDMRGILAKFDPIAPRGKWENLEGKTLRDLQVWTSEGTAGAIPVAVRGPIGACKPKGDSGASGGKDDKQADVVAQDGAPTRGQASGAEPSTAPAQKVKVKER